MVTSLDNDLPVQRKLSYVASQRDFLHPWIKKEKRYQAAWRTEEGSVLSNIIFSILQYKGKSCSSAVQEWEWLNVRPQDKFHECGWDCWIENK